MTLLSSVISFLIAHWPDVLKVAGGLYSILIVINGLMKDSPEKIMIGKIVNWLSVLERKDAPGTLKLPFSHGKAAKPSRKTVKPAALIPVLILASAGLLASCACWTPEHRNDKTCVVLHQAIDCTEDAVVGGLSHAAQAIIGQFINGSTSIDWDGLLGQLEAAGIKDGGCILAQLENDFMSKPSASPEHAARAHGVSQALQKFKRDLDVADVKYCFRPNGSPEKVCR